MATTAEEIRGLVERLVPEDQQRVLEFARELARPPDFPHTPLPPAKPHDILLTLRVSPEVADAMERALEDCELVDEDE